MKAIHSTFLLLFLSVVNSYKVGDQVELYVNKVGPYFNPHETYHYYEMPVCRPNIIEHKSLSLGEVLDGDRMAKSIYKMKFNVPEKNTKSVLCELVLSEKEIDQLKEAIEQSYYYEFVIDDIPVRDFIGHVKETGFVPHSHIVYLWTHQTFNIYYNNDKIVYVNTSLDHNPVSLEGITPPITLKPTYTVNWIESKITYAERNKFLESNKFFPHTLEIHWISIINSAILVALLIGFVFIILMRIVRKDLARYNEIDLQEESDEDNEYGWKIIHTDVFRMPKYPSLFAAILGVGTQFVCITFGIMFMAMMGLFHVHRHGAVNVSGVMLYAVTSFVAGYVSASFYKKMEGQEWVKNINLTTILFTGPLFFIWAVQNTIAWVYSSTQALPFTTVMMLMFLWLLVGYPLTIIGGIIGHRMGSYFNFPCRTKNFSREIPFVPWYKTWWIHSFIGGFLPFSAISVELYYIFSTLWGRESYTLYGILSVVFFLVLSVTSCVSVSLTYFQLSSEDYRWWWRSIYTSGSTGIFVVLYSLYYYYNKSNMSGLLQSVEFLGWSLLAGYVTFLTLGTVSFMASLTFVRFIYANIKMD